MAFPGSGRLRAFISPPHTVAKEPVFVAEEELLEPSNSLEKRCRSYGGTDGSNLLPSSGESGANLIFARVREQPVDVPAREGFAAALGAASVSPVNSAAADEALTGSVFLH